MNVQIIIALIQNVAILVAMVFVYSLLINNRKADKLYYRIAIGVFNGLVGILLMWTALKLSNGVIFDTRSVLISVSGMFFGTLPTAVSAVIMCLYRYSIGGPGLYMGIFVVITTSVLGILGHKFVYKDLLVNRKHRDLKFYLFGVVVHIDMLLCMVLLPADIMVATMKSISLPVIILYPIGTYLLCKILMDQMEHFHLTEKVAVSEAKYRSIAENTSDMIFTMNTDFKLTYVSPSSKRMFGQQPEEYLSTPFEKRILSEDQDQLHRYLLDVALQEKPRGSHSGEPLILECRHLNESGEPIWISISANGVWDEKGKILGLTGTIRDIDDLKKIEIENDRQHALTAAIIDAIPDLIFYKDIDGVYQAGNIAFAKSCGKLKSEIFGRTDYDLFSKDQADGFRNFDNQLIALKKQKQNEETFVFPDGTRGFLDTVKIPFWASDGTIDGIIGISRDITERKLKENEINHIAFHDYLTGLYNRRYYEEELKRLDGSRNLPLTIVMGDVNGLKLVNDSFGHEYGDQLLKRVGEIMKSHCRKDDIIARFGGDEFVILLPQATTADAEQLLDRINRSLSKESIQGIDLSVSFGIATKLEEDENIEIITRQAEDSMYRHKLLVSSSVRSKTIDIIMNTLYEKNNREMQHSKRVSHICEKFASYLKLKTSAVERLKVAGLVHDIGKIGIDEKILNSPGKLTAEEWDEMKKHSEIGYRILSSSDEFSEIAVYVLEHQEKWDGKGYPRGIGGTEISMEARIISIADAFDAMTRPRTYGTVFTVEQALDEIEACAGSHFDPELASAFVQHYDEIFSKAEQS